MKFSRHGFAVCERDTKRTRHAEMHQQHVAGGKIRQQIFGAATQPGHKLAIEPRNKILLEWKSQIAAPGLDSRDPLPLHYRLQAATDGFNLGQFGHRKILTG
jgi:hypothetical protein